MSKKKIKLMIYIDNGMVWPLIKVCNHDQVEVIVVNNDQTAVWKPQIEYNCDREIEDMSEIADALAKDINYMDRTLKGKKHE